MSRVEDRIAELIAGEAGLIVRETHQREAFGRRPAVAKGLAKAFFHREREGFVRGLFPTILPVARGGQRACFGDGDSRVTVFLSADLATWWPDAYFRDTVHKEGELVPSLAAMLAGERLTRDDELATLLGRATARVLMPVD